MRVLLACVLVSVIAVGVSGCGGSGSSSSSTTPPAVAGATTTTAAPPTTTTVTAPPTTTTSAGPPLCRAADLQLSFRGGQAATGHGLLGFELRNTSTATCSSGGYPGVQFLSRSGASLPTAPTHTTQDFFGSLPLAPLTVAPGADMSFRLGVTHGAASTAGCTTAYALQVIPPNDTATLRVAIPNGAYECGTVTVSPVVSGTAAYP
jgi:hypothetical protein